MKNLFLALTIFCLTTIFLNAQTSTDTDWTDEEMEIINAVENLLFFAGNYNIEAVDDMVSDNAIIAYSFLDEGKWTNREMTIEEYFEGVKNRDLIPFSEIPTEYDIILSEGRLATVRADAILYRIGIPRNREINHMTLIKEGEDWKFLDISWIAYRLPDEERKFDLDVFAESYARVWCSQKPEFVAMYFAEDGSLSVNDGNPAVSREEISKVAEGFMTTFPDMIVEMDSLITTREGTEFHWTLTGTHNETGNEVKISGVEVWQLDNGLIKESNGSFDTEEYKNQVKYGY